MARIKKWKLGVWLLTIVVSFVVLFPVYWIIISSLTEKTRLFSSPIDYFPNVTFANYVSLFTDMDMSGMINGSLSITACSMLITMVLGFLAAYAISRVRFKGSLAVLSFFMVSSLMSPVSMIIPLYDFMKSLNLVDTFSGIVFLYTSSLLPFTVMIFSTFIGQLPIGIEEAAYVDGANRFETMWWIIIPLLRPAIATMAIINFINCMNEFFLPMIFSITHINTLSLGISRVPIVNQYQVPWEKISAMGTLMVIPIVLFVVCFEKNIMDGLMAGSLKQ